jgi:hypothetical protein
MPSAIIYKLLNYLIRFSLQRKGFKSNRIFLWKIFISNKEFEIIEFFPFLENKERLWNIRIFPLWKIFIL